MEVLSLSDLHGRVDDLPRIAAEIAPVRARGPSLLLDAGDSAQGTVEASALRGATRSSPGWLHWEWMPPRSGTTTSTSARRRRAARIAAAPYPTLAANLRDARTRRLPGWKNLDASRLFRLPGGPVVGVFGLSTPSTPRQTMPANTAGLRFGKLAHGGGAAGPRRCAPAGPSWWSGWSTPAGPAGTPGLPTTSPPATRGASSSRWRARFRPASSTGWWAGTRTGSCHTG